MRVQILGILACSADVSNVAESDDVYRRRGRSRIHSAPLSERRGPYSTNDVNQLEDLRDAVRIWPRACFSPVATHRPNHS